MNGVLLGDEARTCVWYPYDFCPGISGKKQPCPFNEHHSIQWSFCKKINVLLHETWIQSGHPASISTGLDRRRGTAMAGKCTSLQRASRFAIKRLCNVHECHGKLLILICHLCGPMICVILAFDIGIIYIPYSRAYKHGAYKYEFGDFWGCAHNRMCFPIELL